MRAKKRSARRKRVFVTSAIGDPPGVAPWRPPLAHAAKGFGLAHSLEALRESALDPHTDANASRQNPGIVSLGPGTVSGAVLPDSRSPGRGDEMKKSANARFAIKTWDEKAYSEAADMPKLTRATVTKTFTGDIEGEGRAEYLMMYRNDGSATFVGLEQIVGRLDGKAGSFVLQRTGTFEGGLAKESYFVIAGSGTGELRSLRGDGTSAVGHDTDYPFQLNCELDEA